MIEKYATFLVTLIIIFSCVCLLPVKATPENSWTTKLSMPTARFGLGVATVNNKIYAIGGWKDGSGFLGTNEEYEPENNTWIKRTDMPTPRAHFGIATWENKIYVFGGDFGSGQISTVEMYNPLSDSWENKTSMPTPRSGLRANTVGDKIYLIGGYGLGVTYEDKNEVYYPASDSWTTEAPVPIPTTDYASAVVGNKIYVMGGRTSNMNPLSDHNQVYDTVTKTWDFETAVPEEICYSVGIATQGFQHTLARIYVIVGAIMGEITNHNLVYDPESGNWTTGTPMPTKRYLVGATAVQDIIYVIGGSPSYSSLLTTTKNEQYTPFGYDDMPPEITNPIQEPNENVPAYQNVTVTVNVTDEISGIDNVTLWYSTNNGTIWLPLIMSERLINTYQTTIPGYENSTWVTYRIIAYDNAGNNATKDNNGYDYKYQIILEFSSSFILPLFMVVMLLAALLYKRKH